MASGRNQPTVDSYDRIRGEVPPPPEWTATAQMEFEVRQATTDPDPPGYLYGYTWSTPVFDLRPDLASQVGTTKQGVPIWRRYARLRIQIAGQQGSLVSMDNWEVTATPYVSIFDANVQSNVTTGGTPTPKLFTIGASTVTDSFYPAFAPDGPGEAQSALGNFSFPGNDLGGGEGYPARYVRIEFSFVVRTDTGLPLPSPAPDYVPYALSAAVY